MNRRAVSLVLLAAIALPANTIAQAPMSGAPPIGGRIYDDRGSYQGEVRPAPGAPAGTLERRGPRGEYQGDLRPVPGGGYEIRDERGRYKGEVRPGH